MNEYLYLGYEEKNGKYRIFLAKKTDTGMKPILAYGEKIGLYFPYSAEKPSVDAGKIVSVKWHGIGKIESISERA